ncbi:T9SS type A sorting domain-containing protein [Spirosoma arcticum]
MKTFTALCLMLLGIQSYASHLRGGYIQTRSISETALTYEITITLYLDGPQGTNSTTSDDQVSLCLGDGSTQSVVRLARVLSTDRTTSINTYRLVHTYAGPGTYTLTTTLSNRTAAKNITGAEELPMTLTTTFSTTNGINRTPTLLFPENGFLVATNQQLNFPLQTTDAEGDSLVYALTRPLTSSANNACTGRAVATYQYPNDLTRRGTFTLANRTGNLTWNAPVESGNYSVAVTVGEYRNGLLISQTLIEVSLVVVDRPGTPGVIPPYEPALEGGVVTALPGYRDEDITLSVFPNPVDDRLQVVVQTSNPATARIQLLDSNGRTLHEMTFGRLTRRHEQVISMGSLTPGFYVLHAKVGDRTLTRKVVKK